MSIYAFVGGVSNYSPCPDEPFDSQLGDTLDPELASLMATIPDEDPDCYEDPRYANTHPITIGDVDTIRDDNHRETVLRGFTLLRGMGLERMDYFACAGVGQGLRLLNREAELERAIVDALEYEEGKR